MNRIKDEEFLEFIGKQEAQYLVTKDAFEDQVLERVENGVQAYGDPLPWSKTDNIFRFRPGEVTIIAGVNGSGKSLLTGMYLLWLSSTRRIAIASMEMSGETTLYRQIRQASGSEFPSKDFAKKFLGWQSDNTWIYDQTDTVKAERILGMINYCASKLKIDHVCVDSLMKCGIGKDDLQGQANFVNELCYTAKRHKIHIHLIHHMRKGSDINDIPDKFGVRGAGEVTDMVDNVLIVHRNRRLEEKKKKGLEYDEREPEVLLIVDKQRNGEWEGPINLWFHQKSFQYLPKPSTSPMMFSIY